MHSKPIITWADLNDITAYTSLFQPNVLQCEIECRGAIKSCILLLPDAKFSLVWHDRSADWSKDSWIALGRVIASHAAPPSNGGEPEVEFNDLAAHMPEKVAPQWADLPEVWVTPAEMKARLSVCALRSLGQNAILFLTRGMAIPMGSVNFSDSVPSPPLLCAVARLVVAHAEGRYPGIKSALSR